jgi:hypothetical protein
MAREAGLPVSDKYDGIGYVWCSDEYPIDEPLQRFANLIAAAERSMICDLLNRLVDTYENTDKQGNAEDIRKLIQHIKK